MNNKILRQTVVISLLSSLLIDDTIYLPLCQTKMSLYDNAAPDLRKLYLNFRLQSANIKQNICKPF